MQRLPEELFEPEPHPRDVRYTIVSVDDHLVEPAGMFDGRLPRRLQNRAPRVVTDDHGDQMWEFEGARCAQIGLSAFAGRRRETVGRDPCRFEDMRPGCWDIHERIRDMDVNGVWASLNFPSMVTGFCGRTYSHARDPELGLAVTKAWNDWLFEEWYSPYPDRIIPLGITYLTDPARGAAEIRRNADRGFRAISFPERPHRLGLPSVFDPYWHPFIEACVETETVVCLHVGSSGAFERPPGAPAQLGPTLFGQLSLVACAEWLWSGLAVRYPSLALALSEGGIGWVPMLLDRLDNMVDRSGYGSGWSEHPSDVLQRNFWFCTIDDPSTIELRRRVGVERIMVEVDYPHGDSTWPDTQTTIEKCWGHIPSAELRAMCSENAARLFRHPLPPVVMPR
jgi:predicted TIM-barrel fold metal-dependent hydrolase